MRSLGVGAARRVGRIQVGLEISGLHGSRVATQETGEETVEPLLGLVTVTMAKAGATNDRSTQTRE